MIYPQNYEQKIGFDEIRRMLKEHCQSSLGQERVDEIAFSADADVVNEQMAQVREMRRLMQAQEKPEMNYFFDVRESVARIRLENTHLEEDELWDLRRSLETIGNIVDFLNRGEKSLTSDLLPHETPGLILGCHAYGAHSADIVQEVAALMCRGTTIQQLRDIIHIHPTLGEILKAATE